jgi:SAM-dependent methyltransferase
MLAGLKARLPLALRRRLEALLERAAVPRYKWRGRIPWTPGYVAYREALVRRAFGDAALMQAFADGAALPAGHGTHCDERVVEYPWIMARLPQAGADLLDAGSALNFGYLLDTPPLRASRVTIFTLAPEGELRRPNLTYLYGDLRRSGLADNSFDLIVSISTLEHVGMDNTRLYTGDAALKESRPDDYLAVVTEFKRLLRPGGRALVTVPYGRYQDLGWLQQFEADMLQKVIDGFGGSAATVTYYRYGAGGWQVAAAGECAGDTYFDVHREREFEADYLAAARAVACLELVK